MKWWPPHFFDLLILISALTLFFMFFILLVLTFQCTYNPGCYVALMASIFGVPNMITMGLFLLDVTFLFENIFSQVMFASLYDTNISFGHFLYGIFCKSHLVRSLPVCVILFKWPSCSSAHTTLTCTGLHFFLTASTLLSLSTIAMLIWTCSRPRRAVRSHSLVCIKISF